MSLLKNRLDKDKMEHIQAEQKVEQLPALKASAEEMQIADEIIRKVSEMFAASIASEGITDRLQQALSAQVEREVDAVSDNYEERSRIRRLVTTSMFGYGPLEPYLKPSSGVTDIIVQRYDSICISDNTGTHKVDAQFNSEKHLQDVIQRIVQEVGRQINLSSPTVDARLKDMSRVHATLPPISPDGATLTIRRFHDDKLGAADYIRYNTMDKRMLTFLACAVRARLNILISGGTDSGKTTLLNMLSGFIPNDELIITIEDNCELKLRQPNVRRLETREANNDMMAIDMQRLIKETLRMRPDRIIVGESRDGSIVDMFSAMSTGHEGSMSTIHANSPSALVNSRIPTLFSMYSGGGGFTDDTQTYMTAEALQLIIQINRVTASDRRITDITAVNGIDRETKHIKLVPLFRYLGDSDSFEPVNTPPEILLDWFQRHKVIIPDWVFDKTKEVPATWSVESI